MIVEPSLWDNRIPFPPTVAPAATMIVRLSIPLVKSGPSRAKPSGSPPVQVTVPPGCGSQSSGSDGGLRSVALSGWQSARTGAFQDVAAAMKRQAEKKGSLQGADLPNGLESHRCLPAICLLSGLIDHLSNI